jgi:hypothetical protein
MQVVQLFRELIPLRPIDDSSDTTGLDLCYNAASFRGGASSSVVPALSFVFRGGARMDLPLPNYFIPLQGNVICLALAPSLDISIIGNVQQQNFHVLYDLRRQLISFTPASCDSL